MNVRLFLFQPILKVIIFVYCLCFFTTIAHSSHAWGADITYKHLGGNQYEISLTLYHDCYSTTPPPVSPTVNVTSLSCGQSTNLSMIFKSTSEISTICSSQLSNSACNGGSLNFGESESVYTGVITLPGLCSDWNFSYSVCCRPSLISNSQNPQNYNLYVESTLNNIIGTNNSPTLHFPPVYYACSGVPVTHTLGAIDVDCDSLVYKLINPLDDATTQIPYSIPFSAVYPISTVSGSFWFNSLGIMQFTPDVAQAGIITVLVEEYRNGQMIGSVIRDFFIIVVNSCPNNNNVDVVPTSSFPGNVISSCPGETLAFTLLGTDMDVNDTVVVSSNISSLPGASLITTGANPLIMTFNWQIPVQASGVFPLIINVSDNACPLKSDFPIFYKIHISSIEAGLSDSTICAGSVQAIQLNASLLGFSGNGTYQWSPATGLSDPTIANPVATVTAPISYTVSYTEGACSVSDQINIDYEGILTVNPTADTICVGNSVQLNAAYQETNTRDCGLSSNGCTMSTSTNQIGTDNTSTGPQTTLNEAGSPFLGYYHDGRWQAIYKASELHANGITKGLITEIALEVSQVNSTMPYSNFTVGISCTQDSFSFSNSNFIDYTSTVYSGTFSPVLGWNTFVFSNHYYWNGVDDLVVQICFDNNTFSNYDHVFYTETTDTTVIFERIDWSIGCALPNTNTRMTNKRANIRFTTCDENYPQYNWLPATGLNNPSIANPIASPNNTTTYTVSVNTGNCIFQDTIMVLVNQDITVNLNSTQPGCMINNGAITITANGGIMPYSYTWSDPTIGNSPTATGLSDGIYVVTVTDNEGCIGTASSTLSSTQSTPPTGIMISDSTACPGDTISLMAVGGSPGGGGVLVYYEGSCGGIMISNPNQVIVSGSSSYFVRYEDSCGVTSCASVGVNCFAGYLVETSVLLEGPYQSTTSLMSDDLRVGGLLPYTEPYTALGFQHLNGGGNESTVASVFSTTGPDAIVDWIFVELREAADDTTPFATRSALLQADGDIVDMDGVSGVDFTGSTVTPGNYWVVIRHRSHISVMSSSLVFIDGITPGTYDFNTQGAFGNGILTLPNGDKVLYEGDINQDGAINSADRSLLWNARNQTGYLVEDSSLDGFCMANDRSQNWNNKNVSTQVP